MKLAFISGRMVNIEQILFINALEDKSTGEVVCNFVLTKDYILQEKFKSRLEFEVRMEQCGIFKTNLLKMLVTVLKTKMKRQEIYKKNPKRFRNCLLKRIK